MANGKTKAIEKHKQHDEMAEYDDSIVSVVPDYLKDAPEGPVRGGENVEPGDHIIPRLAICGKQSPQFDEQNERFIEGLKIGQFFNSVTREIYGAEIFAVPLFEVKTRAIFRLYGEDGPPICLSTDGKRGEGDPGGECRICPERQFTRDKNGKSVKPRCSEIMSYAVLLMPTASKPTVTDIGEGRHLVIWNVTPRVDTVSLLGFKSTSLSSAKTWNTLLDLRRRDWFSGVYRLTAVAQSDGKNSWHIPMVENAGWLSQAGYELCKPAYESIKGVLSSGTARIDEFAEKDRQPGDEA